MAESKISDNGWVRIATIRSESNASHFYILGIRGPLKTSKYPERVGKVELACDCMAYRNFGNPDSAKQSKAVCAAHGFFKTCKHTRALIEGTVNLSDLSLTSEGVTFLDALKATGEPSKAVAVCKAKALASKVA